jgi:hypothetical protein
MDDDHWMATGWPLDAANCSERVGMIACKGLGSRLMVGSGALMAVELAGCHDLRLVGIWHIMVAL